MNKGHFFLNLLYQMTQASHHFNGHQMYIRSKIRTSAVLLIRRTRDTSLEHKNNGNCTQKSYVGKLIVSNYVAGSINNIIDCRTFQPCRPLSAACKPQTFLMILLRNCSQSIQSLTLKGVEMSLYNISGESVYREEHRQSDK